MTATSLNEKRSHVDDEGGSSLRKKLGYFLARSSGPGWKRYGVAWLSCFGLMIILAMRSEMGIAIIKMTRKVPRPTPGGGKNFTAAPFQEVAWTHLDIGIIEASFFIGYALFSIPGGYMASYLSPNLLLGSAVLITCVLNVLVPSMAHVTPASAAFGLTLTVRLIQGMAEGCLYPAVHGIWRYWAPEMERSRLATISFFGMALGPIIGLPLSGLVTSTLSWQVNFYLYGTVGCAWAVVWFLLVHEQPSKDPHISRAEAAYIEEHSAPATNSDSLPVSQMATSLPVWAIVVANVGRNWSFQFSMIGLPAYYSKVFGMNSEEIGLHLMLPFLLMAALTPVGGYLADSLRGRYLSTTVTRRLFNTVGFGVMAASLVVVGMSRSLHLSTAFLTLGLGFTGIGMSGYAVNHLDIVPRFAGFLMGVSNGVGTISGVLSPIIASRVARHGTAEEWQAVFTIASVVHVATLVFYLFCSSGEKQPWASPGETERLIDNSGEGLRMQRGTASAGGDGLSMSAGPNATEEETVSY
uniref:MFS domain-containing protein n=1 Tax=Macrostomum lignano TaxID=282301 RepID=A0A1I8JHE8_9PLAT